MGKLKKPEVIPAFLCISSKHLPEDSADPNSNNPIQDHIFGIEFAGLIEIIS